MPKIRIDRILIIDLFMIFAILNTIDKETRMTKESDKLGLLDAALKSYTEPPAQPKTIARSNSEPKNNKGWENLTPDKEELYIGSYKGYCEKKRKEDMIVKMNNLFSSRQEDQILSHSTPDPSSQLGYPSITPVLSIQDNIGMPPHN